jgi:DtxR family Mn-dependent transcriptional regulator
MPKELLAEVTVLPELESTSEAEQMYLISVARETEAGAEGPIPVSRIAGVLSVSVPSANEMIRKLEGRGLLTYEPYRGVRLSPAGGRIADQVLRTRRLWATFLAEHLGFSPAEADEQACHLEHATTPDAADRLAGFLGNPQAGPLGHPIPSPSATEPRRSRLRLAEVGVGVAAEVVAIVGSDAIAGFLGAEGVATGSRVTVIAAGSSGMLVECDRGQVHLDQSVANKIEVRRVERGSAR